MRRVLIFLLAIVIFIPLCAVSISAAEYDLVGPSLLSYSDIPGRDRTFPYFGRYGFGDIEGQRYWNYSSFGFANLIYMDPTGYSWSLGGPFPGDNYFVNSVRSPFSSSDSGLLAAYYDSGYSNSLMFASFVYEGIMLPVTGQFLKISLDIDAYLPNVPVAFEYLLDPTYFCFLCDDYGVPGASDNYSLPKLSPTSITSSINNRGFVHYDFYFNYSDIDSSLFSSQNICLGIRIPYYLPSDGSLLNSSIFYSATNLPTSYEILTIGGYDEQLSNIENAIYVSNQSLIDLYTNQSESDRVHVITGQQSNDVLSQGIKDYQSAAVAVGSMKDDYSPPPMQSLVSDNLNKVDTSEIKDFFGNSYILSAVALVFSFCIIRLILYGTKEG